MIKCVGASKAGHATLYNVLQAKMMFNFFSMSFVHGHIVDRMCVFTIAHDIINTYITHKRASTKREKNEITKKARQQKNDVCRLFSSLNESRCLRWFDNNSNIHLNVLFVGEFRAVNDPCQNDMPKTN